MAKNIEMKNLLFAFTFLPFFFACNEDDETTPQPVNALVATGIIGTWEIEDRSRNNISDA